MKQSRWRSLTLSILISLVACTVSASLYADDYEDDDLDSIRKILTSQKSRQYLEPDTNRELDAEENDSSEEDTYLGYPPPPPPSDSSTISEDEEDDDDRISAAAARRAIRHWLKAKAKRLVQRQPMSKRSPSCMRKCMAQGLLHPAQCHSLC